MDVHSRSKKEDLSIFQNEGPIEAICMGTVGPIYVGLGLLCKNLVLKMENLENCFLCIIFTLLLP